MSDEEAEQIKDVYAHFGLAIYTAQVLEHGIVNALIYLELIPSRRGAVRTRAEWEVEFDAFSSRHFGTTLGKMIRNLAMATSVSPDLEALLADALERRNWLAHDYFRERAEDFMSSVGRERMLIELREAQGLFDRADGCLGAIVRPMAEKYGITAEKLEEVSRQMLARARDG